MSFKPAKSRSLVLKKGEVTDRFRFSLGAQQIPSVTEKPVKSLGKVFNCSLNDRESIKDFKFGGQVKDSGQVRAPWKIQGLDIPAWNPPKNPLAFAHPRGTHDWWKALRKR